MSPELVSSDRPQPPRCPNCAYRWLSEFHSFLLRSVPTFESGRGGFRVRLPRITNLPHCFAFIAMSRLSCRTSRFLLPFFSLVANRFVQLLLVLLFLCRPILCIFLLFTPQLLRGDLVFWVADRESRNALPPLVPLSERGELPGSRFVCAALLTARCPPFFLISVRSPFF